MNWQVWAQRMYTCILRQLLGSLNSMPWHGDRGYPGKFSQNEEIGVVSRAVTGILDRGRIQNTAGVFAGFGEERGEVNGRCSDMAPQPGGALLCYSR